MPNNSQKNGENRKAPWMKFYPSDWRSDTPLHLCSFAARGLWADMMTLMHEAEPYGHLLIGGIPATAKDLAGLLNGREREITQLLGELEARRVFSRTSDDVIYSRRMIRDAEQAVRDRENGRGGGNPNLKPKDNPTPNGGLNGKDKGRDNLGVNPPLKAQKLEARVQKESKQAAATAEQRPRETVMPPCPEMPLPVPSPEPAAMPLPPDRKPVPRDMRLMPKRSDDEFRWVGLGDGHEVAGNPATAGTVRRTCRNGWALLDVAERVCQAAMIYDEHWRGDWWTLTDWLDAGIDPNTVIIPAIRRCAARPNFTARGRLSYFDKPVREAAGMPQEDAA